MVTSAPRDKASARCVLDSMQPSFTKIMYNTDLPHLFGAVPQSHLRCCLELNSSFWPKQNITHDSHIGQFFFQLTFHKNVFLNLQAV